MISKITEADIHLFRLSKPSMYSLANDKNFENQIIPINPNLLTFKEKAVEIEYSRELYLTENYMALSEEFVRILTYFYTLITLIFIILPVFAILLHQAAIFTLSELLLHILICLFFLIAFYFVLYLFSKSKKVVLMNKNIYTIIGILVNSYFIICNSKILSGLIKIDYVASDLPLTLALIIFTSSMRNLLFDCFFHYFLIILHAIVFFLILNLAFSPLNIYSILSEIAIIIVLLSYELIECHISCTRSKSIF